MLKSFVGRAGAEFNTDHIDEDAWARLADAMTYISGDLTKPDLYEDVRAALDEAEKAHGTRGNAIFYLAVADRLFGAVVEQLGKAKLTDQGEDQNGGRRFWRRVVIEKPFGHSLDFEQVRIAVQMLGGDFWRRRHVGDRLQNPDHANKRLPWRWVGHVFRLPDRGSRQQAATGNNRRIKPESGAPFSILWTKSRNSKKDASVLTLEHYARLMRS